MTEWTPCWKWYAGALRIIDTEDGDDGYPTYSLVIDLVQRDRLQALYIATDWLARGGDRLRPGACRIQ